MRKILYYLLAKFRIFDILQNQETIKRQNEENIKLNKETLKASIFNSTISESEWLKFKSFSPGGWAADYGLLYTLYRVLNGMKPSKLLEFGLGQSSKLLHQYANYYKKEAITCEHDSEWVCFFKEGNDGDYPICIEKMELANVIYKGHETLSYKNVSDKFVDQRFDLIVVDGPFGSEHFSRSQIISLAGNNLMKSFCIIIDDYERQGERETVKELFDIFEKNGVEYCSTIYSSTKEHILICSKDLKFLTTL